MFIELIICAIVTSGIGIGLKKIYNQYKHNPRQLEIRFFNNFYHDELILTLPYNLNEDDNLDHIEMNTCALCKNSIFMDYMELLNVKFVEVYDVKNKRSLLEYCCAYHNILSR